MTRTRSGAGIAVSAAVLVAIGSGTGAAAATPVTPTVGGECVPGAAALCDMPHPVDPIYVPRSLNLSVTPEGPFNSEMRVTAVVKNGPKAPFPPKGETVTFTIDGETYTAVVGADDSVSVVFHPLSEGGVIVADLPMKSESAGLIIKGAAHAELEYTAPENPGIGSLGGFLGWLLKLLSGLFGFGGNWK
ncbi:hypothetical protein M0E87_06130 [Corynebacterium sp. CCM 9185]|uniref:Secreted protein n=1 Tax=Corynebacterium marambiense TaxID=2765364 RepID=A0ABS0VUP1_9CORY|nr:hypothetical protein [Corynebacterium marambiense]MBI9000496.1 hypothetical protein [Corynebacterium marambiense]MCK7663241.1 hypothetical protein [Corynebacterium marambiense]MCX7542856.1 hypothetical protein [Corynebacterium marambiense]